MILGSFALTACSCPFWNENVDFYHSYIRGRGQQIFYAVIAIAVSSFQRLQLAHCLHNPFSVQMLVSAGRTLPCSQQPSLLKGG